MNGRSRKEASLFYRLGNQNDRVTRSKQHSGVLQTGGGQALNHLNVNYDLEAD